MSIEEITTNGGYPWELLLEADPNKAFVSAYLQTGRTFVYRDQHQRILGVIVIKKQLPEAYEVMNLSVSTEEQNKGIGRRLLTHALEAIRTDPMITKAIIKTGDLPSPALSLYKSCGFMIKKVIYNYFIEQYPEPLYENGQQLKNQVVLEKQFN